MGRDSLDDFVARAAALPLHHQPGTEFQYGISSDILGAVVEKAAGRPLEAFVEERLLAPLGMSDTGFDVPDAKRARLAKTYTRDKQGRLVEAEAFSSSFAEPGRGFASGGGGMFSTAGDYARFAQMLLNGGQLDGVRILGRKTVELMTQNQLAHARQAASRLRRLARVRARPRGDDRPLAQRHARIARASSAGTARRRPTARSTPRSGSSPCSSSSTSP